MDDILSLRFAASPDAVESQVGDETVLLHLGSGTYYGLDPLGTRIWQAMKDGAGLADTCRSIADEYGVETSRVEDDTRSFLKDLVEHDIIVEA